MRWKWGESQRDRHEVAPPGAPFAALSHWGCLGGPPGWGCSLCPPHVGEDPGQVRHREAWTAIGSRAPCRVHPAGTAADEPREWRCPYTCLCLYGPPGLAKFTEMKWDQLGIKRTTNLFDLGEFFSLKTTFLFPGVILAFSFAVLAQPPFLLRTSWLKAGTGGL